MVYGSWYALTSTHNADILIYSLSVSCLTSALLLSNELRDHESDVKQNLHTLTVRIGFRPAQVLYALLVISPFFLLIPFYQQHLLHHIYIFVIPFMLCLLALKKLKALPLKGEELPPFTGKLYMVFGVILLLSLGL
jgi:1,4-dihydroxy-2-naphthoate octaprenyltransferase